MTEDDIDIYEDLPSFDAKETEKLKEEIKELTSKCDMYQKDNLDLQNKTTELVEINKKIAHNFSSLLKTAKAEISRKDRMITELRQQIDNATFRRSGFVKINKPKPPENMTEDKKFAPFVRLEVMPSQSQRKPRPESDEETIDTEQKYEPEKITSTVFGERLRKRILIEQEMERIQKEEEKLVKVKNDERIQKEEEKLVKVKNDERIQKEEEKLVKVKNDSVPVEPITENASNINKTLPQEVISTLPEEVIAVCSKSSAPSSKASSTKSYEEDDKNLIDRRELSRQVLGKRFNKDDFHSDHKRRKIENERYQGENSRHYNENIKIKGRFIGDSSENSRSSRDTAKQVYRRRGSNNREEMERTPQVHAGRSKSNHRSRSRTPDRRYVERRSDRHRTDKYKDYISKYKKGRQNKSKTKQDNCGKILKDLREKFEHTYKNQFDNDCKKENRESPSSEKSRSSEKERTKGTAVDKRRGRRSKSSERLAKVDMESSKHRDGPKTRSRDRKFNPTEGKNSITKVNVDKSSTVRPKKDVTNKEVVASSELLPQSSKKEVVASSNLLLQSSKKEVTKKEVIDSSELLPQSSKKEVVASSNLLPQSSKKEVTKKEVVASSELLPQSSKKDVTKKEVIASYDLLPQSSKKELTNKRQLASTPLLPDSLVSATVSKEKPVEKEEELKEIKTQSKDSKPICTEVKIKDSELISQAQTKISHEKEEIRKQITLTIPIMDTSAVSPKSEDEPDEIKNQSESATIKSKEPESIATKAKDVDFKIKYIDSETKSKSPPSTSSKEEITNKEITSFEPLTEDLALELQSDKSPDVQKDLIVKASSPAKQKIVSSQNDNSGKWICSVLENSAEVSFTSSDILQPEIGSRSFREEKIENIEKFILNYQDDENFHCKSSMDVECENKSCNSTSSILDTLSMDVDDVGIGKESNETADNSLSKRLLLESLSTPVKKNASLLTLSLGKEAAQPQLQMTAEENNVKPPLPLTPDENKVKPPLPLSPEGNKVKPPLPSTPEDNKVKPPLPLTPEENKVNPPLPPTPEENKIKPPLPPFSPPEETQQSLPLLPALIEIKRSQPLTIEKENVLPSLSSPIRKQNTPLPPETTENQVLPPLPSPEKKKETLPPHPSPDTRQNPSLLPENTENQVLPPLTLPDEKKQSLPALSSPDTPQNPSLLPENIEILVLPSLPSPVEKKQTVPALSTPDTTQNPSLPPENIEILVLPSLPSPDEKKQALPSLPSPDIKQNESLSPPDTENQALPSLPSPDEQKQTLLSIPASDKKLQSILLTSTEEKTKPSLASTSEEKLSVPEKKSDLSSSLHTYSILSNLLTASKKDSASTQSPAPVDENIETAPKEIFPSKSELEKPPTQKITLKQAGRPRIPCIPIVSKYSRKRRDLVLTDFTASRCIVKSISPSDIEKNNNGSVVKVSHILTKELKVTLKSITPPALKEKSIEKSNDNLNPKIGNSENISAAVSKTQTEKTIVNKLEIASNVSGETEKKSPLSQIVAPLVYDDKITNSNKPQCRAQDTQPQVESKDKALTKIQKLDSSSESKKPEIRETRSALKTTASSPNAEDLGVLSSRNKPSPKEKENQTKEVTKQSRIMVVAKRRRPLNLEDSSTAMTVVSSGRNINSDESSKKNILVNGQKSSTTTLSPTGQNSNGSTKKNDAKNNSSNSEKLEVAEPVIDPSRKKRKRRSTEKR